MIAYVKGNYVDMNAASVIVDTPMGIGYLLHISLHTYTQIKSTKGGTLYTYFHVKEDAQNLYGFADLSEKTLFTLLISISGVGPSTALMALSSLAPNDLTDAILSEDVSRIKAIKGIGPKTAQRIILELKDKLAKVSGDIANSSSSQYNTQRNEALTALLTLGIARPMAQKAIDKIQKQGLQPKSTEDLIKLALNAL